MPRVVVLVPAFVLAALLLTGCGNKGQLVLPDQQPAKHTRSKSSGDPTRTTPTVPEQTSPDPNTSGGSSGNADGRR